MSALDWVAELHAPARWVGPYVDAKRDAKRPHVVHVTKGGFVDVFRFSDADDAQAFADSQRAAAADGHP